MHAWSHELGDVLLITHKDTEQVARVAGYIDSLDDTTPLLVNLRISDGLRWGERQVKIQPSQIIKPLPDWYTEQDEKWQASIKATADATYARMTPEQREELNAGMAKRRNRSPLDIMIDRAVGRE